MFKWLKKDQNVPEEVTPPPGLAQLRAKDLVVLFKHSPTCPVSWAAEKQVKKFIASHPEVPVQTILVRRDRALSDQIEKSTGVRHESPQVIVMRQGVVVADASHQDVTADFLTEAVGAQPNVDLRHSDVNH